MRHLPARPLILLGMLIAPAITTVAFAEEFDIRKWPIATDPGPPHWIHEPVWSLLRSDGPDFVQPALVSIWARGVLNGAGGAGTAALMFCGSGWDHSNAVWILPLDPVGSWSVLRTTGTPPSPRRLSAVVYDSDRGRVILFGGVNGKALGDLWQLDLEGTPAWSPLVAEGAPPPPVYMAATVYDTKRDRMILVMGPDGSVPDRQRAAVWALELSNPPRWRNITPQGTAPAPRAGHTAIYDPRRDQVLVFGGFDSDELWGLSFHDDGASWTRIEVPAPGPRPRAGHSAILDPLRRAMIVHGGIDGGIALNDTWALSIDPPYRWRRMADGMVRTGRWGHGALFVDSWRMLVVGGWGAMGSTHGLGRPWSARSVAKSPRLAAVQKPDTTSQVPAAPLKLAVRMPNPTRGTLGMELALPAKGVRLELFDVTGRRIASRDLSDLGPGYVRYRWDATERLPAGIYLMRLSRAKETVKKKVILLR